MKYQIAIIQLLLLVLNIIVVSAGNRTMKRLDEFASRDFNVLGEDDDSNGWNHGSYAVMSKESGIVSLPIPPDTQLGDYLFLFISRTDGFLPIKLGQWNLGAECFKTQNGQVNCLRASDCIEAHGNYCLNFRREGHIGIGKDLAVVMYFRKVTIDEPCHWNLKLRGNSTTWAVMTSISNVNDLKPILSTSNEACDERSEGVFPSVFGRENDVLLLSLTVDDKALLQDFQPPDGTSLLAWISGTDEAGFLFGKRLSSTGQTGQQVTSGRGGSTCKDALLSIIVNRAE